jgi:hypothetical protein
MRRSRLDIIQTGRKPGTAPHRQALSVRLGSPPAAAQTARAGTHRKLRRATGVILQTYGISVAGALAGHVEADHQ